MPRTCTICTHKQRTEIEAALRNATSFRDIARQFQVSKDALARHRRETNETPAPLFANRPEATNTPPIALFARNATGQTVQSVQVKKSRDINRTLPAAAQFVAVHDATGEERIVTGTYWQVFGSRDTENGWRLA